jgi:hypothetical protein
MLESVAAIMANEEPPAKQPRLDPEAANVIIQFHTSDGETTGEPRACYILAAPLPPAAPLRRRLAAAPPRRTPPAQLCAPLLFCMRRPHVNVASGRAPAGRAAGRHDGAAGDVAERPAAE